MNWILRILASIILCILCALPAICQTELRKADKLLEVHNFQEAISLYQSLLSTNPDNQIVHLRLANAFRLNNQLEASVQAFERAEKLGELRSESNLIYGDVLMGLGQYKGALKQYSLYGRDYEKESMVMLEKCRYAIEHSEDIPHFKVDHEYINTSKRDFGPEFFGEELVYLSNRSDIKSKVKYRSNVNIELLKTDTDKNGFLKYPKRIKSLTGTAFNVISIAYNEKLKLVAVTRGGEFENIHLTSEEKCTLYIGRYDTHGFVQDLKPYEFNLTDYSTGFASFSEDGETMYFSSDRPGGKGGFDIYKSELIGGKWSAPIHIEQSLNSPGNEITPRKTSNTLFFASDYHPGFGGYDIFKSSIEGDQYLTSVNLGTAINSSFDEYGFIYDNYRNVGYLVSNRKEGKGLEDLFRIQATDDFLKEAQSIVQNQEQEETGEYSILKGMIVDISDNMPIQEAQVNATIDDGSATIEAKSNQKGLFSIPLLPGEYYNLKIEAKGYLNTSRTILMKDIRKMDLLKVELAQETVPLEKEAIAAVPTSLGIKNQNKNKESSKISKTRIDRKPPIKSEKEVTEVKMNDSKSLEYIPNESIKSEPAFAIQIAAISKNVKSSKFSNLKDLGSLYTLFDSRVYKVRCGLYSSRKDAMEILKEIRVRGYQSAFIVEERPSDMLDLVMLDLSDFSNDDISMTNKHNTVQAQNSTKSEINNQQSYKVRLATYNNPKWFDSARLEGIKYGEIEILREKGKSIYLLRGFKDKLEALSALEQVKSRGFIDAILINPDNL